MSMTTTELAANFETTPRTLRKFLRSDASGIASVGKGSRYALPSNARSIAKMKRDFDAWQAARTATPEDETPATDE